MQKAVIKRMCPSMSSFYDNKGDKKLMWMEIVRYLMKQYLERVKEKNIFLLIFLEKNAAPSRTSSTLEGVKQWMSKTVGSQLRNHLKLLEGMNVGDRTWALRSRAALRLIHGWMWMVPGFILECNS